MPRIRGAWCWLLCALLVSGCATRLTVPERDSVAELTNVPFYPQTAYDCGPAALATILSAAGVAVTPETLIDLVYVDGLHGSLQAELTAATRRFGLLPVPTAARFEDLLHELASGRPVLVLLNLGLERAPIWHYAVVVGYDAERSRVTLRSGADPRRRERARRFLRQWELAGNWGLVAVEPGDVPASTAPEIYMRSVVGAQRQLGESQIAAAYAAALARWPDDPLVLFLAAAREQARMRLAAAESLYRKLLAIEPGHAAARNNLANVLLERGCRGEALREARLALDRHPPGGEFDAEIRDTLQRIEAAPDGAGDMPACVAG